MKFCRLDLTVPEHKLIDSSVEAPGVPDVLRLAHIDSKSLYMLLQKFGLKISLIEDGQEIPGSHWGDDEAGLILDTLYCRGDTPVHSILHESCHWILMDEQRRSRLHTDAGGTSVEENAVCYLQLLLADQLPEIRHERMCQDMDAWGYSFRLGNALEWFEKDADDAIAFLKTRGFLVNVQTQVTECERD